MPTQLTLLATTNRIAAEAWAAANPGAFAWMCNLASHRAHNGRYWNPKWAAERVRVEYEGVQPVGGLKVNNNIVASLGDMIAERHPITAAYRGTKPRKEEVA